VELEVRTSERFDLGEPLLDRELLPTLALLDEDLV